MIISNPLTIRQPTLEPPVFKGIATAPEPEDYPQSLSIEPGIAKSVIVYGLNFLSADQVYLIPEGESNLDLSISLTAQIIDSNRFFVTVLSTAEGIFDLLFVRARNIHLRAERAIEIKIATWVDFRLGGTAIKDSDWRKKSNIVITRNAEGMTITGDTGWDVGVGYLPLTHSRSYKKTYEFVGKFTGSIMIGVLAADFDLNRTDMYYLPQIAFWLRNSNTLARFYGEQNNFNINRVLDGSKYHRLLLENNGEADANYYVYQLPSGNPEDWDDTSNLVISGQTPSIFNHASNTLCPGFIQSSLGATYTAIKLS